MQIGMIALKIRNTNTRFGNLVGGAAELDVALRNTLQKQMAFVLPLNETVTTNEHNSGLSQIITERFGVVVALQNDTTQAEKNGVIAYDNIDDTRTEIFKALLGWQMENAETIVEYAGGRLLGINGAYLWYQFDFQFDRRIVNYYDAETNTCGDGVDIDISSIDSFDRIYADYRLSPASDLPYTGDLPIDNPDMQQIVDFTVNPNDGSYFNGFGLGFKIDLNK